MNFPHILIVTFDAEFHGFYTFHYARNRTKLTRNLDYVILHWHQCYSRDLSTRRIGRCSAENRAS